MSNWLKKLGLGLQKSSSKLTNGLNNIFTPKKLSSENIDELEELLISTDMGISASNMIIKDFSSRKFATDVSETEIRQSLAQKIEEILSPRQIDFSLNNDPEIILFTGVNGAGKTTTIGKLASKYAHKQISLIAADTFRAAAVEQLKVWGERNQIRVYSGPSGCDAAGLCYEGLAEALKHKDELIFIDTAGRLQNKTDLMNELKKIIRVIKKIIPDAPHHIWLCLDATTGQNALDQVKTFKEAVNIDGLIINKLDGSAKGGILVAIAAETALPILFVGVGEGIDDLNTFNAHDYAQNLLGVN